MNNRNIMRFFLWLTGFFVASSGTYFLAVGPFARFDTFIAEGIVQLRTPFLNLFMYGATLFGRELLFPLIAIVAVVLFVKKWFADSSLLLITMSMAGIAQFFLKMLFARERPTFSPLVTETTFSFPSGHSLAAVVFYGFLVLLVFWETKDVLTRLMAVAGAVLVTLTIGFSRVYLGVHWPSDVIGGYVIGFWILYFAVLVRPEFIKQFANRPR